MKPYIYSHQALSTVTTIVSADDHDEALEHAEADVQMTFADNPPDSVLPLPLDEAPAIGPDAATAESLIQEAIDHAEI
jgi:hypothetical protein